MKLVVSVVVALGVALLACGCTTSGNPRATPDLAAKALPASEFGPGATVVPPEQVPSIVADITLRPVDGEVTPAHCTPAAVDTDTAAVVFAPGPAEGSTMTEMVARTEESLDDLARAASECAAFRGGSTGQLDVATRVVVPPAESGGVQRMTLIRTLTSPGNDSVTTAEQWIAQRGDVRVLVQLRYLGAVGDDAKAAAQKLFDAAVRHAFR